MKKGIALLLAGVMMFGLTACGKGSGGNDPQAQKEFYYLPEYKELQMDVNYISNILPQGDVLFLIGFSWNEETEESTGKMYRYDLLSDTCEEMILPLPENASVQNAVIDSEENLLMIVNRYEEIAGDTMTEDEDTEESYENVEYENYVELWQISGQDAAVISQTDI